MPHSCQETYTLDPYEYQCGFGNRFASEAIPDVLPRGQNCPKKVKYDLFSEQLNGSGFISPRASLQHVWMYRIRPSVAHKQIIKQSANHEVSSTTKRDDTSLMQSRSRAVSQVQTHELSQWHHSKRGIRYQYHRLMKPEWISSMESGHLRDKAMPLASLASRYICTQPMSQ